jgi:hypothetical protein
VTVRYTPATRDVTGALIVTCDTPIGTQHVVLSGRTGGFDPPDPEAPPTLPVNLTLQPTLINFGPVPAGQTRTVTLHINNATGRPTRISVAASTSGPFRWPAVTRTMNSERYSIDIQFTSTGAMLNAALIITSDTPASPQRVPVTGKGVGGFPTPARPPASWRAQQGRGHVVGLIGLGADDSPAGGRSQL